MVEVSARGRLFLGEEEDEEGERSQSRQGGCCEDDGGLAPAGRYFRQAGTKEGRNCYDIRLLLVLSTVYSDRREGPIRLRRNSLRIYYEYYHR